MVAVLSSYLIHFEEKIGGFPMMQPEFPDISS